MYAKNYNFIDKLLHYLAFSSPIVQKVICDLENDLFKRQLSGVNSQHEVFVTGLPRSGTTLILELLYGTGEFQTFTYRQMPFILSPLLWDKVSKPFQKKGALKERAHQDGMKISFDSPEAFEEIIWLSYLKNKFVHTDVLSTLSVHDITKDLANAIEMSVKKLLVLADDEATKPRYLSKNNANISRIEVIAEVFPTSTILVPFRHPATHVSSLKKQHEKFTREHGKNSFSRHYMEWLGHFEFGENFKPINFEGWLDNQVIPEKIDEDFWLKYWVATYSYILAHKKSNLHFIDFDKLLKDGKISLQRIAECVSLNSKSKLLDAAQLLRSPTSEEIDVERFSPQVWNSAEQVYNQLKAIAV